MKLKRPAWLKAKNAIIALPVIALIAVLGTLYGTQAHTINQQNTRILALIQESSKQADRTQSVVDQYAKLYGQSKASGVKPTTPAPSQLPSSSSSGPAGAAGHDGRGIAFSLCTANGWEVTYSDGSTENAGSCEGLAGKPGSNGKNGADGADGQNGSPGSSITGPAGPTGSTGADGPKGDQGPTGQTGTTGATGAAGVGVSSITCVTEADATTAFRFTLTNGSTQDVAGACTPVSPSPDPQ